MNDVKPPLALVPGITDKETADDLRKRIVVAIQPLLDLLSEAKEKGFEVQLGMGPVYGTKIGLTALKISREF
jgi:hypothetical protein